MKHTHVEIDFETFRRLKLRKAETGIPFKYLLKYLVLYADFPDKELKELWEVDRRRRSRNWGKNKIG